MKDTKSYDYTDEFSESILQDLYFSSSRSDRSRDCLNN